MYRHAEGDYAPGTDLFLIVREDHSQAERRESENVIVCINQKNGEEVLVVRFLIFFKGSKALVKEKQ